VISSLLRAEAMTAGYGKMAILHDVTFIVTPGELVAVIGPNGAGKSTAFKVIVGFLKPTEGRVLFDGDDITGLRPDQVLRRGLAYVPQGRIVFPQMTVLENLEMGAYIEREARKIRASLDRVYALFPILGERRHQKAGTMSGGEQQMVAIGRALMAHPRLILLDEPSMGLAPRLVAEIFDIVARLNREERVTVLLAEQNAAMALRFAGYAYVMESGRIVLDGDSRRLSGHPDVQEFYLGQSSGGKRRSYRTVKQYRRSRRWYG
jgi:branched-chain amino acid transport system ATP-binding protein